MTTEHVEAAGQGDYFANHARARQVPWTLYHQPLEKDLAKFLGTVGSEGEILVVGCGLLHEIDAAPSTLRRSASWKITSDFSM